MLIIDTRVNEVDHELSRSWIAVLLVAVMVLPTIAPLAFAFTPVFNSMSDGSVPGTTDAIVVYGTLAEDRYDLWQYTYKLYRFAGETPEQAVEEAKLLLFERGGWHDLRVGMTEYGEFLVVNDTLRAGLALGPDFNASESFAGTGVDPQELMNGWLFYIRYKRVFGPPYYTNDREVLAWAVGSDGVSPGSGRGVLGKWGSDNFGEPTLWSDPFATQQGTLVPHGIMVLYESARLAIFRTNVSIFDNVDLTGDGIPDDTDWVADIVFTVVFNKVKKYFIVYKDVVIRLTPNTVEQIDAFVFSNREKLDIAAGINTKLDSYVHFYEDFAQSAYNYPILHWNNTDMLIAYNDGDPTNDGIVTDTQYVVFKFYWPNVTEYTVRDPDEMAPNPIYYTWDPLLGIVDIDDRDGILPTGTAVADIPGPLGEPAVPFVIVQWKFERGMNLAYDRLLDSLMSNEVFDPWDNETWVPVHQQLRFVEVIGMTQRAYEDGLFKLIVTGDPYLNPDMVINPPYDRPGPWYQLVKGTWDANDTTTGPPGSGFFGPLGANSPGIEPLYFWKEVFDPFDLNDVFQKPFKLMTLGFYSPPEDTAGSSALAGPHFFPTSEPFPILDRFIEATRRSIPYALFSTLDGQVNDTVDGFWRVKGLLGFAFEDRGVLYDGVPAGEMPQPIAGGFSEDFIIDLNETHHWVCRYFYPSVDQLYERVAWCDLIGKVQGNLYEQKVFRYPVTNYSVTGLINIAGPKANMVTRYYNDFYFAILRESLRDEAGNFASYALINDGSVTGFAPTSNPDLPSMDIFPVSTWKVNRPSWDDPTDIWYRPGDGEGYFVVAVSSDVNGTLGYSVWGWNARDSYWGSVWAAYFLGHFGGWLPDGTVALIVKVVFTSNYREPQYFEIVHALGTITEFKLEYEFAFGNGGMVDLGAGNYITIDITDNWFDELMPPYPGAPTLDTLAAVNAGEYNWTTVGIPSYIEIYISEGGGELFKKIGGWPWWGGKLPTKDGTGYLGIYGPAGDFIVGP